MCRLTLAFTALTLLSGCGSDFPTAMVSGSVSLNGEPFTGAAVHFYNPEVGGGAFNLDTTGKFTSAKPIPVGEYMVSLDRPGPIAGESVAEAEWPEDHSGAVPAQYRKSATSGLVARVSVGEGNHFEFDMRGAPIRGKQMAGPVPLATKSGVTH